ncbi:MAG: thioredoxin family protein [Bacillota bacterium]
MNKKGLLVLVIILLSIFGYKVLYADKGFQGELQPAKDAGSALKAALEIKKPVFLEFTSDNCPACKKAKPWIEELYQEYGDEVTFILADVDKGGLSLAQHLGVRAVPTFVFYSKEGEIVDAFEGYPPTNSKEYLEEKIKGLLE